MPTIRKSRASEKVGRGTGCNFQKQLETAPTIKQNVFSFKGLFVDVGAPVCSGIHVLCGFILDAVHKTLSHCSMVIA